MYAAHTDEISFIDTCLISMGSTGSRLERALGSAFPENEKYIGLENVCFFIHFLLFPFRSLGTHVIAILYFKHYISAYLLDATASNIYKTSAV